MDHIFAKAVLQHILERLESLHYPPEGNSCKIVGTDVASVLYFKLGCIQLSKELEAVTIISFDSTFYRKDVRLPKQLQRAMAAEAEATREAKAKVTLNCIQRKG